MLAFAQKLYDDLQYEMGYPEIKSRAVPVKDDQPLALINTCLNEIKEKLKTSRFDNEKDEMYFFKYFLPELLSQRIYYKEQFDLDFVQTFATSKSSLEYCAKAFERMELFYRRNWEFIRYYLSGETDKDKAYFIREHTGHPDNQYMGRTTDEIDYCTIYTVKAAAILAYSTFKKKLNKILDSHPMGAVQPASIEVPLKWTGSKMELIELIYALNESSAFNYGNTDLKKIAVFFEGKFGIKLGNISSGFQKILMRKKGHTHFLDKLKGKLDDRMNQVAEGNT